MNLQNGSLQLCYHCQRPKPRLSVQLLLVGYLKSISLIPLGLCPKWSLLMSYGEIRRLPAAAVWVIILAEKVILADFVLKLNLRWYQRVFMIGWLRHHQPSRTVIKIHPKASSHLWTWFPSQLLAVVDNSTSLAREVCFLATSHRRFLALTDG